MKKTTVYELICLLSSRKTDRDQIADLVGAYPLLSHMILTGRISSPVKQIFEVVPEVTAIIVENRLHSGYIPGKQVEDVKPGKAIRPKTK